MSKLYVIVVLVFINTHVVMQVRMDAYRNAILNNPSLLKSAVVMDVGCGTGVLR